MSVTAFVVSGGPVCSYDPSNERRERFDALARKLGLPYLGDPLASRSFDGLCAAETWSDGERVDVR